MDTIGTFKVAEVLAAKKCITAVHKHYTIAEWKAWATGPGREILQYVAVSTGILQKDIDKLADLLKQVPEASRPPHLEVGGGRTHDGHGRSMGLCRVRMTRIGPCSRRCTGIAQERRK